MVEWHYQINGHEFEPTLGDSEAHGGLDCCSPWGRTVGHNLVFEQQLQGTKEIISYTFYFILFLFFLLFFYFFIF